MITVLCPPMQDLGPNDYQPTPSQAHYLCVDEDPNDGDATILTTAGGGREVWKLDVSAIPDGSRIFAVRIRTAQKQTTAGAQSFQIGHIIGGHDFFTTSHNLTSGSAFLVFDDNVGPDPSDGADWTKDRLARAFLVHNQISQPQALPRPHLTECVVFADIEPPRQARARTSSASPAGAASGSSPVARSSSTSPRGAVATVAPAARVRGTAPRGTAVSTSPAARAASPAPRAVTVQDLDTLQARVSSSTPRASVASSGPRASVAGSTNPAEVA